MLFEKNIEEELFKLQGQLAGKTYTPGDYREFTIYERKPRKISAAPYRDRVVHHALCNVIEPIFEKAFIFDSYACRKGKGTHQAVERFTEFCRKNKFILKMDIKKYFPSMDHAILLEKIGRKIKCPDTLWLIKKIIDGSNRQEGVCEYFPGDDLLTPVQRRRGIPIGNLTSQFFANIYLDGLDHFAKEKLRCMYYIRYVDDISIFGNDKRALWTVLDQIGEFLAGDRLKLHPQKTYVAPVAIGVDHLGYRIYPTHRRLRKDNSMQFRRKLAKMARLFKRGRMSLARVNESVQSWIGHARHADTYGLRRDIFGNIIFSPARRENSGRA